MHFIHKDDNKPSQCTYLNVKSKSRGPANQDKFPFKKLRDTSILFIDHHGKPYRGWDK